MDIVNARSGAERAHITPRILLSKFFLVVIYNLCRFPIVVVVHLDMIVV
jgi:hypothetical protein